MNYLNLLRRLKAEGLPEEIANNLEKQAKLSPQRQLEVETLANDICVQREWELLKCAPANKPYVSRYEPVKYGPAYDLRDSLVVEVRIPCTVNRLITRRYLTTQSLDEINKQEGNLSISRGIPGLDLQLNINNAIRMNANQEERIIPKLPDQRGRVNYLRETLNNFWE